MGYAKQKNMMILWGIATSEPKLYKGPSGVSLTSFFLQYNKHVNEDGQKVKETIGVTAWRDLAEYICDDQIGIGKYDIVLVAGEIVQDTYYGKGEDPSVPKYKINAELVLDITSVYQMMMMVVNGGAEIKPPKTESKPKSKTNRGQIDIDDESDEEDSLFTDDDSDDGELPF